MGDFVILVSPLEATVLVLVPVVLMWFRIVSAAYRLYLLGFLTTVIALLIWLRGGSAVQMGFSGFGPLHETLLQYGVYVLIAVPIITWLAWLVGATPVSKWWREPHFTIGFIPISAVQQLLFQSIFLTSFVAAFGAWLPAIMLTAFLFGIIHVIYPRPGFSFVLGTIGGICFAILFLLNGNVWVAIAAHALLNFVAVQRSLFSLLENGKVKSTKQ